MMNLHISICDDCAADVAYLEKLVKEWAMAAGHFVVTRTYTSAENFLFYYAEDKSCDILLLDIEMESMDGVSLAKEIRRDNEGMQIVFITGYSDYIADGYEVAALHYLMKPVAKEKLFTVLDRAAERVKKNEPVLLLNVGGEMVRLPQYEVRYFEVNHNYVTIHAKQEYSVKMTLGEIEKGLDERFFRLGRSYIVNLSQIGKVTKTDVYLTDGARIPLPSGWYEKLNRAIITRL